MSLLCSPRPHVAATQADFLNAAFRATLASVDTNDVRRKRLRAALDGVELAPEQTQDDKSEPDDAREQQILRDVPPHHGTK